MAYQIGEMGYQIGEMGYQIGRWNTDRGPLPLHPHSGPTDTPTPHSDPTCPPPLTLVPHAPTSHSGPTCLPPPLWAPHAPTIPPPHSGPCMAPTPTLAPQASNHVCVQAITRFSLKSYNARSMTSSNDATLRLRNPYFSDIKVMFYCLPQRDQQIHRLLEKP